MKKLKGYRRTSGYRNEEQFFISVTEVKGYYMIFYIEEAFDIFICKIIVYYCDMDGTFMVVNQYRYTYFKLHLKLKNFIHLKH